MYVFISLSDLYEAYYFLEYKTAKKKLPTTIK